MHRHGYKGRKLGRVRDQRRLLIKNLATELIDHQKIRTTTAKAKEVIPYLERLITKAKKGGLHNRRQVIAKLATPASAHKLFDQIAPQLNQRSSGYLRLVKLWPRLGDGALLSDVQFVDSLSKNDELVPETSQEVKSSKPTAKQTASQVTPKSESKSKTKQTA